MSSQDMEDEEPYIPPKPKTKEELIEEGASIVSAFKPTTVSLYNRVVSEAEASPFLNDNADNPFRAIYPSFKSLITALNKQKRPNRLDDDKCAFMLESYEFLLKHRDAWKAIHEFSGTWFYKMNQDVEKLVRGDNTPLEAPQWSTELFKLLTSPNLPLLPTTTVVARCVKSSKPLEEEKKDNKWFDIEEKDSFELHRPSSTTLMTEGFCGKGSGTLIYMWIKSFGVHALCIDFEPLHQIAEEEVILPPNIKMTWNKNTAELKSRMSDAFDENYMELNADRGEFVSSMGALYRAYDATPLISAPSSPTGGEKPVEPKLASAPSLPGEHSREALMRNVEASKERIENRAVKKVASNIRKKQAQGETSKSSVEEPDKNLSSQLENERRQILMVEIEERLRQLPMTIREALATEEKLGHEPSSDEKKKTALLYLRAEAMFAFLEANVKNLRKDVWSSLTKLHYRLAKSRYAERYARGLWERFGKRKTDEMETDST
jgi:hypothetical protein